MARQNWARITANVEPKIKALAKVRARQRRQSVASYVTSLIESDLGLSSDGDSYSGPGPIHINLQSEVKKKA